MEKNSRIYVAGHTGMVGSAIMRRLQMGGYTNLLYKTSDDLDLRDRDKVQEFFKKEKPEYLFMAAAVVGGIQANKTRPVDFLMDNIDIQNNMFRMSYKYNLRKMIYLGSACMMPRNASQPMSEEMILTSSLEPTNEAYAIAKIQGIKACEYYNKQYGTSYIGLIPSNCYGINDNFDLNQSHVIPAMIRRYDAAKRLGEKNVTIWGSGEPMREFLYVDDLADACIFVMNHDTPSILNIGSGEEITMLELSQKIKNVVGFSGNITCDISKPDGMPRRIVDNSKIISLGWKAKVNLDMGLKKTYKWFLDNVKEEKDAI